MLVELGSKVGLAAEPAVLRDVRHREVGRFEEFFRSLDPLSGEPDHRAHAGQVGESAGEGPFARVSHPREIIEADGVREVVGSPSHHLSERAVISAVGSGRASELCLPPGSMRCQHESASKLGGDDGTKVLADYVEAEIDGC